MRLTDDRGNVLEVTGDMMDVIRAMPTPEEMELMDGIMAEIEAPYRRDIDFWNRVLDFIHFEDDMNEYKGTPVMLKLHDMAHIEIGKMHKRMTDESELHFHERTIRLRRNPGNNAFVGMSDPDTA